VRWACLMLLGDADDEEEEENDRVTMMRMKLHACERREREREKIDHRPFLMLLFFFQTRKTPQSSSSSRRGLRSSLLARQDRTDKEDTYLHTYRQTFEQNHLHFATVFLSLLLPWLWLLGSSSLLFVLAWLFKPDVQHQFNHFHQQ